MEIYTIKADEQAKLNELISRAHDEYSAADDKTFLEQAYIWAAEMPRGIYKELNKLKSGIDHSGCLIIRGFENDTELPKTPICWSRKHTYQPNQKFDYLAMIMSSALGDAFGFETQQDGKLIHDILPIKGKEYFQAGCSSLANLSFHTEDAFHPHRPDFLCFLCLKNPTHVGTAGISIDSLDIPDEIWSVLLQPRFYTLPDNAHSVDSANDNQFHSILFGNWDDPFICLDPDFTYARDNDDEAKQALNYLVFEINSKLKDIPIQPGDLVFLDNLRWVHGRKPFEAKFDGNDRWLKRICITSDLKKSAEYKSCVSSRLIYASPINHKAQVD